MSLGFRSSAFGRALSSEANTVDASTAEGLNVPAKAQNCLVTAGANAIRWRVDGNDPTASVGHYLAENESVEVYGDDMNFFKFISTTGSSACFITYFNDR